MGVLRTISDFIGSDHGGLLGLGDDDHIIYLLASGARNLTGNLGVDALVTIDGRDISVDGSTLDSHLDGTASQHDASEIDVEGTYGNIPGTPTDLESALSAIDTALASGAGDRLTSPTSSSTLILSDDITDQTLAGNLGILNITATGAIVVKGRDIAADGALLDSHLDGGFSKHDSTEIDYEEEVAFLTSSTGRILFNGSQSVDAAKVLANSLKTIMNAHAADGAEHFKGGAPSPDTTNFPVTEADATTYATLITLTNALTVAYSGHASDGADPIPVFHNAQTMFTYQLSSTSPVEYLYEIISRLNNIKFRFNQHDTDTQGHTVGTQHQEVNTDVGEYGLRGQISTAVLNLMGHTYFSPLDGGNSALGSHLYSWQHLMLDNGVTDGGAVYFNDNTTSFLKSSADGLTLNIGGFTAIALAAGGVTFDGRDVSVDGGNLDTHLGGGSNLHDASEIDVEGNYSNISGTPTDLESTINAIDTALGGVDSGKFSRQATAVNVNSDGSTIIGVTNTAAPRTITLDSDHALIEGKIIIVKDESGGAFANNITIDTEGAETIDGVANVVISANYGRAIVYSDGTNWVTL